MDLALLVGLWTTVCVQTQTGLKQGFVRDSYEFAANGQFTQVREWYTDRACTVEDGSDRVTGDIRIIKKASGMFAGPNTYEVDFETENGTDLGALSLQGPSLKVARGMSGSTMRNTMLSMFEFKKQ